MYQDSRAVLQRAEPLKAFEDAHQRYFTAIREPYRDYEDRFREEHRTYVRELQHAWGRPDAAELSREAHRKYALALKAAWDAVDARPRLDRAYREYVQELLVLMTQFDAATLDPHLLGYLGQQIASACWYAEWTFPRPPGVNEPEST